MGESSIQALLREGIAAAKLAQQNSASTDAASSQRIRRLPAVEVNQRERARALLLQVVELDERNIPAWLWLSTVVDRPEEKQTCLENVLTLDPNNKHALAGLARLGELIQEDAVIVTVNVFAHLGGATGGLFFIYFFLHPEVFAQRR